MRTTVMMLGLLMLGACVTRTYEKETVVQKQPTTQVVPVPQGSTGSSSGDTTIIVPR